jgi:hypothetical protein
LNPMFYCLTACTQLLLATFDPNCEPHAYPYLTCATPDVIREITQLQDIGSTESQLFSVGLLLLSMAFLWLSHRSKPSHSKVTGRREDLARHSSKNDVMPPPMARRRSTLSRRASSTWLDSPQMARRRSTLSRRASSTWLDTGRESLVQVSLPHVDQERGEQLQHDEDDVNEHNTMTAGMLPLIED